MVQRKLADKLGIQADHVESNKGSSPSRNQYIKNEGAADLKKTMEKSRSMQHSDIESLRTPPPTSDHVKTRAATPQRQSPEGSPNYMKSTCNFDARRKCSQVSSRTPQNIMIRKSMSPMKSNDSRLSSGSVHKLGALARTSGLKVARTLIKTPSFKPARASTKKYSPTCSSTLKDLKMPMHLELIAGATESEGTSATKVCPYTYCSLNGHHHAPVPPLKSFLSAKRRMLKAQKVIKLGCLSPCRAKPSRERMVEIDTAKGNISESLLLSTTPGFVTDFEGNLEAGAKTHPFPRNEEDEILGSEEDEEIQCNTDEESQPMSQYGQSDSKASEVESEEGHHYEPGLNEDILTDEVRVGFYDERSVSSGAWSDDGESDLDGSYHNMDLGKPYVACSKHCTCNGKRESVEFQVRENSISHLIKEFQATSVEKSKVPESSTGENDGNCESVETQAKENSISHSMEEFQARSVEKSKVPEASDEFPKMNYQCTSNVEEVALGLQGDEAAEQEHVSWLLYQDFIKQDQVETHDVLNNSFLTKTEYEDADQEDYEKKISTSDARDGMEEKKPLAAESFDGIRTPDSLREDEQEKPMHFVGSQPFELLQEYREGIVVNEDQSKQADVTIASETNQSHAVETLLYESNGVENHEYPKISQDQLQTYESKSSENSDDQMYSGPAVPSPTPNQNQEADTVEGEKRTEPDAEETSIIEKTSGTTQKRDHMSSANRTSDEEMSQIAKHLSWTTGSTKPAADLEDVRDFNPREPNFLPEEPDLGPEKVDLRHQLMDERKHSEEWMVDYALRQAVTELAPARSKKVTLLVEAFEKVLPTPSYDTRRRLSHTSSSFLHARSIHSCRTVAN